MRAIRPLVLLVAALLALTAALPAGASPPPKVRVIVVLEDGTDPAAAAREVARLHAGTPGFVYRHALTGFSMELPETAIAALSRRSGVAWIEPDVEVEIAQTTEQVIPTGIDRVDADLNPPMVDFVSYGAPEMAILDTGIMAGHPDLHVVAYSDCTSAILYPMFGGCGVDGNPWDEDGHGHGTHVSGIAAARDNDIGVIGTAPGARLWSIKVLNADGTGFLGGIVAGIDLVASQSSVIKVANMSLGFAGGSAALDTALANATDRGVVFVVAAGNDGSDSAAFSPANHPDVLTVSAMADYDGMPGGLGSATCRADVDDTLADFSNHGAAVDVAAPGVCILSTWNTGGYAVASGTSMATPYVAGAVLRYVAEHGPFPGTRSGAETVKAGFLATYAVDSTGPLGFVDDSGDGIAEPMLYLGTGGQPPPPPPNQPPTASASASVTEGDAPLTVVFSSAGSSDDTGITEYSWTFGDGATSSEANPTHTYDSAGTYTATLTVTDGDGATDTDTVTVTVTEPPVVHQTIHVAGMDGIAETIRKSWLATVTIQVADGDGGPVSGVTVTGAWSGSYSGTATCATDPDGTCTVTSGKMNSKKPSVTFTVTDLVGVGYTYAAGDDVENTITVARPG